MLSLIAFISESLQYHQFAIGEQLSFMWTCLWHMLLTGFVGILLIGAALEIGQTKEKK